jgi:fatty acid desaturase
MASLAQAFRDPQGLRYYGGACAYALLGWGFGLAGLLHPSGWVAGAAALLLAHAMTVAAYLLHECAHGSVFRQNTANARLGRLLSWVCGACYATFEDLRWAHLRHHVDVDDIVWFDYERFFREHPLCLRVVRVLEWLYIPAHELIMHFILTFGAFLIPQRRDQRLRNLGVIAVRCGIFFAVLWWYPRAALLYALAYLVMITLLRFMDSLQHDYDYNPIMYEDVVPPHRGDRAFEREHTFSNPLSFRHEKLNWLTLNFGWHGAHHARANVPWYRLPALHRELFGDDPANVIPLWPQLVVFHHNRVRRISWSQADQAEAPWGREFLQAAREARVLGGNAASFLTPF